MQATTAGTHADRTAVEIPAKTKLPARLWPALTLVTTFWIAFFVVGNLEKPYFVGFIYGMASAALLVLLFFGWWWTRRRVWLTERLCCTAIVIGLGVLIAPFCDKSIRFSLPTLALPFVLTVWTLWMILAARGVVSSSRLRLTILVALCWGFFSLFRIDGVNADLQADFRWRWTPSSEELFLAEKAREPDGRGLQSNADLPAVQASSGDWLAFRGPARDGVIAGVTISTDWTKSPPRQLWRHRVGPAWSSVIVVGDRLYTQEQRDDREAVVCYQAATGTEIWVHEDTCRFWEAVSGAGARATPTFADGRVFTLGATGILNCLDAASGRCHWRHDLAAEAGAKTPLWGFASSPLVTDGLVIVFGGGESQRSLLAYRVDSGDLEWAAAASAGSYSSPQLAILAGKPQCLMLGDGGLSSVDPANGTVLWQTGMAMPGAPRVVQPHQIGPTQLLGTLEMSGLALIELARDGETWKTNQIWASTQMKLEFPDFVVHKGHAYGFDGSIFCCLDLATGNRAWKGGRYGHGQVMLLAEQALLLVLSESGEAILLAANPARHEELGRFRVLDGKTWNHPVIVRDRLYVRNAEEMACYELGALISAGRL
jgi:outer membrane protein assembly factor BamB